MRRTVVALVMLALSLAGIGRGLAAANESGPAFIVVDGFVISLCHTDNGNGGPDDPQNAPHDCCDQCTLRAAIDVPVVPIFAPPALIVHFIEFDSSVVAPPTFARLRTPRLSQGPPAA